MKRLIVALALLVCTECAHTAAPARPVAQTPGAEPLSDGASKIVAALRQRPDIDSICGGGEVFRDAMRQVVMKLVLSDEIEGNPRTDAESAADFLHAHCRKPPPAGADRAGA